MAISFNFSPTSNHLHPLQVENCNSNSRLVVDEDDNGTPRLKRVKQAFHNNPAAVRSTGSITKLTFSQLKHLFRFVLLDRAPLEAIKQIMLKYLRKQSPFIEINIIQFLLALYTCMLHFI